MALLLTTCVTPREIILGRLAGKLMPVMLVLLAGVPALVALASPLEIGPASLAVFLLLPGAVAIGGGGLAVLASTVSRRGREALLSVYMVDVLVLLSSLAFATGRSPSAAAWLGALNPFVSLSALVWGDRLTPAMISIGSWLAIGLTATLEAAWRLRAASLQLREGERVVAQRQAQGVGPADPREPPHALEGVVHRTDCGAGRSRPVDRGPAGHPARRREHRAGLTRRPRRARRDRP